VGVENSRRRTIINLTTKRKGAGSPGNIKNQIDEEYQREERIGWTVAGGGSLCGEKKDNAFSCFQKWGEKNSGSRPRRPGGTKVGGG